MIVRGICAAVPDLADQDPLEKPSTKRLDHDDKAEPNRVSDLR